MCILTPNGKVIAECATILHNIGLYARMFKEQKRKKEHLNIDFYRLRSFLRSY